MERKGSRRIIVAGGGIAGLTAALAFARRGFAVELYERAARMEEVGAGLQLSPNAVHLLDELGVTAALAGFAVRPQAVKVVDARTLRVLAQVRLGDFALARWGAPYLVAHRADLQNVLLARAEQERDITIVTGAAINNFAVRPGGVTVSIDRDGSIIEVMGRLLVGADGVWSSLRRATGKQHASRFSGSIAWRATVRTDGEAGAIVAAIAGRDNVGVFVHPDFHMIAYPLRGGELTNLVAFTRGASPGEGWSGEADAALLGKAVAASAAELRSLVAAVASWTVWPIHTVAPDGPWTSGSAVALIGDAAHAMTPFAAQGAAMAIEDAVTLADVVAGNGDEIALQRWETTRLRRVRQVIRRGALNHLAWNASGPIALARDLLLRMRSPEGLARDLDWSMALFN